MNDLELFLNITSYFTSSISTLKKQLADALEAGKASDDKLNDMQRQLAEDEQKNVDLSTQLAKYQANNPSSDPKATLTNALQAVSQSCVKS